jgi:hypothetical protein
MVNYLKAIPPETVCLLLGGESRDAALTSQEEDEEVYNLRFPFLSFLAVIRFNLWKITANNKKEIITGILVFSWLTVESLSSLE